VKGRVASSAADARVWTWAVGAAVVVHLGAVGALSRLKVDWQPPPPPPVEFELRSPPPPPPPPVETPEPPPPPKAVEPPKVVKVVPRPRVPDETPPPPPQSPPPPNQEPPPEAPKNAPPVFGVTMSSVVSGDSAAAVPVGNTLMAKPSAPRPDKPAEPYAGGAPPQPFRPVPDVYIATGPKALFKVEGEEVYPADARAVGLEGTVKLSVGLNEKGVVVDVKVLERAGHGFDEAAVKAMRQFRYRPALASDGRPVPCRFAYTYKFSMGD
jgi:protein TonB